jgi:arginine deiminase
MNHSGQSEVGKIQSIIVKHPRDAFISQANIDSQWKKLNYEGRPEYEKALEEYETFSGLLIETIPEVHFLPANDTVGLDSMYVRDTMLSTDNGVILCNMGKEKRRPEPPVAEKFLMAQNIPILGKISGEGRLEGGDIIWLSGKTLVVGQGYRTNVEGIRQMKELSSELVDEFMVVPLPHYNGPSDVFHLMSFISPIDNDLAVVYSRLMPVFFRQWLIERGIQLIEVPDTEFRTMACNILAIAPRKCIMLSGNLITQGKLESAGVEVLTYDGRNISLMGGGGPTCLTRPLSRVVE